jgi:predicted nucleotidyltransferase component of viral defense system
LADGGDVQSEQCDAAVFGSGDMSAKATANRAASVRARLLNLSKEQQTDFNQILVRYTLERLLYRIGVSQYADSFLLKGALLFTLWYDMPHRPTRDVDLLGFGASDHESIAAVFRDIVSISVDDGLIFDVKSLKIEDIRKEAGYPGLRALLTADMAKARCKVQIDIGFGDAVTPDPVQMLYPVLLDDMPAPTLLVYPAYTVIAEKLHAIVVLGMANSRLKDYYDLNVLLQRETLDQKVLGRAIHATFERRQTSVPKEIPVGLSDEYANDPSKQTQWAAFLRKNDLAETSLADVVVTLRLELLGPLFGTSN